MRTGNIMIGAVKKPSMTWLVMRGTQFYTGTEFSPNIANAMVYDGIKNATYSAERSNGVVYNMASSKFSKLVKEAKKK